MSPSPYVGYAVLAPKNGQSVMIKCDGFLLKKTESKKTKIDLIFLVPMAICLKLMIFWVVTPCCWQIFYNGSGEVSDFSR